MSEQNKSPKFKPGDSVTWTSQAGGKSKTKQGTVVAVIPPNREPRHVNHGLDSETHNWKRIGFFSSRNHESYLIQVGQSKRLYWPLVKYLKPVEPLLPSIENPGPEALFIVNPPESTKGENS